MPNTGATIHSSDLRNLSIDRRPCGGGSDDDDDADDDALKVGRD